ncbi:acyl-CoA dehydrogenase family protein [Pseudonocardia sp. NPDC049154]|uniref:acyl-CoA dehydrogenase family protein n=1 Tax=Pseudonocardia sp. NPDC049154 TaxID=3155501 RepID=UPI0033EE4121
MLTEPVTGDDAREIRAVVRRFLADRLPTDRVRALAVTEAGYDPADWVAAAEMGWPALGLPEELGGAGYGPVEFAVLCEELGRAVAPGPLLASAGLALPVLAACDDPVARELLDHVAAGTRTAALVDDPAGTLGGEPLNGVASRVLDPTDLLVVAGHDTVVVVDVDAAGMSVEPLSTPDPGRRVARVRFAGVGGTMLTVRSAEALLRARAAADVNLAATHAGGAARALEMTREYLTTRHQFGRPIGSFQALKHRVADAAVAVTLARELVHGAAATLTTGTAEDAALAARTALVAAAEAAQAVCGEAIQLHGGIGFTEEHDVGLYYRRALTDRDLRGTLVDRRAELTAALGW